MGPPSFAYVNTTDTTRIGGVKILVTFIVVVTNCFGDGICDAGCVGDGGGCGSGDVCGDGSVCSGNSGGGGVSVGGGRASAEVVICIEAVTVISVVITTNAGDQQVFFRTTVPSISIAR